MKDRRTIPGYSRVAESSGFKPRADLSRRIAWCIVAVAAIGLSVPLVHSFMDGRRRDASAATALEAEEIRTARESRERETDAKMVAIEAEYQRGKREQEVERMKSEEQAELDAARRKLAAAERSLKAEQDRAMLPLEK